MRNIFLLGKIIIEAHSWATQRENDEA